ncbi:unnamed protein product [Phyllotreta striolata]|uniref:Methyltransferase type 11 domain-containing protein n=1 Tax=Phyllotreta striolata TaxID=444603 RepID=A0A9N9TRV7_PHYSR|nr:unnamed protein product [Phyllotreta striolata]
MIASVYSKNNCRQYSHNERIIENLKKHLKWNESDRILEIGVGDGKSTTDLLFPIFPKNFREYVGIDISQNTIEYLKSHIKLDKCNFYEMDVCCDRLPEEFENRFDHIFSFHCLHWARYPRKALENIKKMLKSEGQFFGTFLINGICDKLLFKLSQIPRWREHGYGKYISTFFQENSSNDYFEMWKNLFENLGFNLQLAHVDKFVLNFAKEEIADFVIAFLPTLSAVKKEDLKDYTLDVENVAISISEFDENKETYKFHMEAAIFMTS